MESLTVLALVSLVLRRAAAGRLVAHVDRAVASVQTVVLASVAFTGGPCEAFWASAGWNTWENRHKSYRSPPGGWLQYMTLISPPQLPPVGSGTFFFYSTDTWNIQTK